MRRGILESLGIKEVGTYEIRREVIVKLVETLRGLRRKPLDVEHLLRDFGPESQLTVKLVRALYNKVIRLEEGSRAKLLFSDWARLFRQATGYTPEELKELPQLAIYARVLRGSRGVSILLGRLKRMRVEAITRGLHKIGFTQRLALLLKRSLHSALGVIKPTSIYEAPMPDTHPPLGYRIRI